MWAFLLKSENKKAILLLFALLAGVAICCISSYFLGRMTMEDVYLEPLVEKGSKIHLFKDYYRTHPLVRDDLVLYRYSDKQPPVVRIARAVPGDHFKVVKDVHPGDGWNLEVNGIRVKSEKDGKPYVWGVPGKLPPLGLYEAQLHGVLKEGQLIVLSAFPPGDHDSGVFGVVSVHALIGRVQP